MPRDTDDAAKGGGDRAEDRPLTGAWWAPPAQSLPQPSQPSSNNQPPASWSDQWAPPSDHQSRFSTQPLPLPIFAPVPPAPIRRRKGRAALIVAAALALIIGFGLAAAGYAEFVNSHSPRAVAERYFAAISKGDAAGALAFAESPPTGPAAQYLTKEVLAQQLSAARLSGFSVTDTSTSGSKATVSVRYSLGFASGTQAVTDKLSLIKHGSSWRLTRVAGTISARAGAPGADRVTFAGRPLPTGPVQLFPGALPLATDTSSVIVAGQPAVKLSDSPGSVSIEPQLSAQSKKAVEDALDAALTKCLAATSTDPLCPMVSGGRPVPGSLHGTLIKKVADSGAAVGLDRDDKGLISVSVDASIDATWKVWDFNNQQVSRKESTTVSVKALSSVDDPQAISWSASNG
ncbi:MAG: hypothetical protein QOD87_389 [Pseudonocardiales bacterium]|nr:hypothetical protein [Pseudonocardiales bacterium]